MVKRKATTARSAQSSAQRGVTKAITDLDDELAKRTGPAGTEGATDSPLLVAVANLVRNYVRWRLDES
jgi:hypothetical protein